MSSEPTSIRADESLDHAAREASTRPSDAAALDAYAAALAAVGRHDEAFRWADRATRAAPEHLAAHVRAMDALAATGRFGQAYYDATGRLARIEEFVRANRIAPNDDTLCAVRLRVANALHRVGRALEAIQLRTSALQAVGDGAPWSAERELLQRWQSDPGTIAQAYAREGHYRGDPGRGVHGSVRSRIDSDTQLAVLVDSLVAIGKTDLAVIAFAHHSRLPIGRSVSAELAGARALLAHGELAPAVDLLASCQLRAPQAPLHAEVNRLLRVGACYAPAQWDAIVARKLALGAHGIATRIARDAADFVPGMETSSALAQCVAGRTAQPFDPHWLDPLRAQLEFSGLAMLDAFFDIHASPTLEHADRLVTEWPDRIAPEAPGEDAYRTRLAHFVWMLAASLTRYLALACGGANLLGGAYRQIATDALVAIHVAGAGCPDGVIRALLEAVERVTNVEPWLLDHWLLRIERAFSVERRAAANPAAMVDGLPHVAAFLRGDDRIAAESRGEGAAANGSIDLDERSVRALGEFAASRASDAATSRPPERALDAHWTAMFAAPNAAGPAANAARVLFGYARPDLALDVLAASLPFADEASRRAAVASLEPLWTASGFAVPHDLARAQSTGYAALQAGQFAAALACYRWCDAIEPGNATTLRNLGFLYAQAGAVFEAVAAFGAADPVGGVALAAQTLQNAGKLAEAVRVERYVLLGAPSAEPLVALARAASAVRDDETAAEAFATAFAMSHGAALGPDLLDAFAGALARLGDYARAEQVARRVLEMVGSQPPLAASALHHLACALLGQRRGAEAVPFAEQALRANTDPANAAEFTETLQRAQYNDPRPLRPGARGEVERRMFDWLARSEMQAVQQLARSASSWTSRRAGLIAFAFRTENENNVPLGAAALDTARFILTASNGATEPDAALARIHALRIREDRYFPVDPPPLLGARMTVAQFAQSFAPWLLDAWSQPPPPTGAGAPSRPPPPMPSQPSPPSGGPLQSRPPPPMPSQPPPPFAEPEIFPGTKIPTLVDYVTVMKALQNGTAGQTFARMGLDMKTAGPLLIQWGGVLAKDATMSSRFQQLMKS